MPPSIPTLGSVFGAAGYDIGYFGKWHLSWRNNLADYGFPEHFTGVHENHGEVSDPGVARAAADWLSRRTGERPWLCVVSFVNPHDISKRDFANKQFPERQPCLPPNLHDSLEGKHPNVARILASNREVEYVRKLNEPPPETDEQWQRMIEYYCALTEEVDGHLGTVLDGCEAGTGVDSAVVVYTSDHGEHAGAHGLVEKFVLYEEAIRVPLEVRFPAAFAGPRESDALVSNVDIVPTICGLTGAEWPSPLPGLDLTPLLAGERDAVRDIVFAEGDSGRRLTPGRVDKPEDVVPFQMRMVRTRDWKYILYQDGFEELYDLRADPFEMANVIDSADGDVVAELRARLTRWRAETGDTAMPG